MRNAWFDVTLYANQAFLYIMKCPHCHTENEPGSSFCQNCGQPLPIEIEDDDNPQLALGTKIFIVVGLIILIGSSVFYYGFHHNDPEYVKTQIEPDSALADKFDVTFDTIPADTANADSTKKSEDENAKKIFNSVRGRYTKPVTTETPSETGDEATETGTEGTEGEGATSSEASTKAPAASTSTPTKPKVEMLE